MSETKVFLLPDLGEGLTEAELVNWLVAVGDEISVDQPIAEVETAKSMVEVPSPYAGTVAVLHGEPGQTLDVGKPLISVTPIGSAQGSSRGAAADDAAPAPSPDGIAASSMPSGSDSGPGLPNARKLASGPSSGSLDATPGAASSAPAGSAGTSPSADAQSPAAVGSPDAASSSPSTVAAQAYREEEKAGSGNVLIGYGTPGGNGVARRTRARRASVSRNLPEVSAAEKAADELLLMRTRVPGKLGAVISPLVRRMAREHGIDLGELQGSGASGLILRRDVEAAIKPSPVLGRPAVERPAVEPAAPSAIDSRTGLGITGRTAVRGVRKAVAANMARSRSEIPEATVWVDVDATVLVELRAALKKADPQHTPGLLAFIARFVTAGLKKFPELNTRIVTTEDVAGGTVQEIVAFDGVNLGFAAQTDRGLMVPSVRNADKLSARELDAEIRRLTAVVREGKATPAELGSGTFTLNNYGVFGVDGSAAIINHPEVGILGVGRIIDKPWVLNGELAVRKVTELTLTFDHRVCDGGTAAGFLRYVADAIENPGSALADM
ncbi:2-oxoisovalerate dehydrogenase E2 component (dihydrolipoyl transacylase) [Arthrobacter sp. V4I6]|uniref:dihydrolipoamide acetyltransferase family protein n=1 Tax=unclassified Arthrobacter TaxID=235627 RepID=UPI00278459B2|nr:MULTISPECIES: dihydrolipoamide acetyltransferase family protein [unclassified Arthrobacter]MDQ0819799.1 2-oxoisovalerate dehydrogenase E2 component (dihydrolipoyl transacylase) [Arthrobacter sp. V1I7]MDQ0853978.1 2-oxoisovalerate dehydrogenase E2 component (dihydrolipoyl transacylase) [Arthrobacter sp. V4I6]